MKDREKSSASDRDCGTSMAVTRRELIQASGAAWALAALAPIRTLAETKQAMPAGVQIAPLRIYGDDKHPVYHRKPLPLNAPRARYPGFKPGKTVLKQGTVRRQGALPLPCDILFERDVAVKMRDGTTIYTDVFRPTTPGRYPAIIAWSPYGKEIGSLHLDDWPKRAGVPLSGLSELQAFEGPDPAFWVAKGYAVLNPDPRGVLSSQGNITFWGRQCAEDGYDFIEWAAEQDWCSGKTALTGNSWLAIAQWYIAAEQPPHLTAIAPWEGLADPFRENNLRGGILFPQFTDLIEQTFAGLGLAEDMARMAVEQPFMTPYWEDKVARLDKIVAPAYVVASYTSGLHTQGTFKGFRRIASSEKWLRVHNSHEWYDYYEYQDELLKFFEHFLEGKTSNGWAETPRIRISVLNPGGTDDVNRVVGSWPPKEVDFQRFHLGSSNKLSLAAPATPLQVAYDATHAGSVDFTYAFSEPAEIIGYMKLRLWVEAQGSDDMDLAIAVQKVAADGTPLLASYGGTNEPKPVVVTGMLRVSQRKLDTALSTETEPHLLQRAAEKLSPGEIVPVDIGLWPIALKFGAGEKLKLTVAAYKPGHVGGLAFGSAKIPVPIEGETFDPRESVPVRLLGGTPDTSPAFAKAQEVPIPPTTNKGRHIIHTGGKYDSFLLVPKVEIRA